MRVAVDDGDHPIRCPSCNGLVTATTTEQTYGHCGRCGAGVFLGDGGWNLAVPVVLTTDNVAELRRYIVARGCNEWRRSEPCVDRKGKGLDEQGRHPACTWAAHMIRLLDLAEAVT